MPAAVPARAVARSSDRRTRAAAHQTGAMTPATILFDLNGTLTDPAAIGAVWDEPEMGLDVLSSAVQSAMVDSLTDVYRPFPEHLGAAIALHAKRRELDETRVGEAIAVAARLPAFPDAAPRSMLVAAHGWDVTGAKRAGLRTCWIARRAVPDRQRGGTDLQASDLLDAARRITP